MNKNRNIALLALLLGVFSFTHSLYAQDTVRVMQYNLFRYGESGKEPSFKNPLLKTIVNHIQPDIIGVNELSGSSDYAQNVLVGCLNSNGETKWKRGALSKAGADKSLTSTIFYDANKFTLINQDTVSIVQREITSFNFMYNDSNLVHTKDTIFFSVFVLHLKAGQGSSEAGIRTNEAISMVNYINKFSKAKNIVIMGDFNVYTSTEGAYQQLMVNTSAHNRIFDPINRPGNWNNNGTFADIHTQSTHSTQTGGFSSGGMDDRFDIMLCSKALMGDSLKMRILPSTYKAWGNDGLHFNQAINAAPTNTSVPSDVLNALYNMSDHLPVVADYVLTPTDYVVGVDKAVKEFAHQVSVANPMKDVMQIHVAGALLNKNLSFKLYSISGRLISSFEHTFDENDWNYQFPEELSKGMYILSVKNSNGWVIQKKLLKN